MSEEQSLKQKTAKGLFWGGLSSSVQQLLGLLFGVVLGRLLDPADYGMIGMLAISRLASAATNPLSCRAEAMAGKIASIPIIP